jgi:ketosteroid isomerase-like protein
LPGAGIPGECAGSQAIFLQGEKDYPVKNDMKARRITALVRSSMLCAAAVGISALPASAANLTRSIEVSGAPSAVWSVIGSFCAIKDWLPPVGVCIEDGKTPPTRTLITKDGKASFVEKQTARNEKEYSYSYAFLSSPLPVTNYTSTIKVTAKGEGVSVVTWTGTFTPDPGKEKDALDALGGVYEAGLAGIQARFK